MIPLHKRCLPACPPQPRFSIFRMFDDVLLLGKGGHLAYAGPSRLALRYLESLGFALPPNENPAGERQMAGQQAPQRFHMLTLTDHLTDVQKSFPAFCSTAVVSFATAVCQRLASLQDTLCSARRTIALHCASCCSPLGPPADFMLDVVCGSVPRQDGSPFQPSELPSLWQSHGRSWVDLHSKLAAKGEHPPAGTAGCDGAGSRPGYLAEGRGALLLCV